VTVICCADLSAGALDAVLSGYSIRACRLTAGDRIPGSYWGEPEAGLIGDCLYVRGDTPIHSALHEACHLICMSPGRRANLQGNAGGDYQEENGVCYLQIVLSGYVPGMGRDRMFRDMDEWGYSFRLGSSSEWFRRDAEDARVWLERRGLLNRHGLPTWRMRGVADSTRD
jgi:hypothetical protein